MHRASAITVQGSLHLANGVLYVGSHGLSAHVRAFDLGGRRLEPAFTFRDEVAGRSSVDGLAVDQDHRIWVADGAARRLRAFTLFGHEIASVDAQSNEREDRPGMLGAPSDVLSLGSDDEHRLVVASAGRRRHALHVLEPALGRTHSLRPLGAPLGRFAGACDLAADGELLYVCERLAQRVQVFRGEEFHYAFELPSGPARREPRALAVLDGGRLVVAQGGPASALLLLDGAGRLLRVLAETGTRDGEVFEPNDVVVEPGADDRSTQLFVIDRDGDRVQVFDAAGACLGAFPDFLELSR